MRLLHLTDRLSQRGGADWHLLGVLAAQVGGGHEVHLAVGRIDDDAAAPPGVALHQLAGLDAREDRPVEPGPLVDRLAPTLIHLHNVVNPAALRRVARLGRPCLMTVQDHRAFCPGRGMWTAAGAPCTRPGPELAACAPCFSDPAYHAAMVALTAARLDVLRGLTLTVLSRYMQQRLAAAGIPAGQIHVIPPFVHGLDGLDEAEDAPVGPRCVLFAGRLVASKGVAEALEVWRRSALPLPLVLAGSGPERGRLRLDQQPGCEVLGWVPHARLRALYRRAAVLLLPSRWQEPFGIVGLEALTLGVPVAAWDSGGVRDWHPGAAQGLVPWGDVEGLAAAARALAGRRAAPPVGFSRAALMARLEALYRALV